MYYCTKRNYGIGFVSERDFRMAAEFVPTQRILRQRKLKINQFNEKLITIETLKLTCQLLGEGWLEL